MIRRTDAFLSVLCLTAALAGSAPAAEPVVDFLRDIRPLLADRCFACHGLDEQSRKADLRLDIAEAAHEYAFVPGDPDDSYALERMTATDPDEVMPPPSANKKPLTEEEIALIRRWVEGGAKYEMHWSFTPPTRPAVPEVKDQAWPKGDIDHFIAAAREERGLPAASDTDPRTLLRRLSFDLTGLPPTPEEVDAFVAAYTAEGIAHAQRDEVFAKEVERLLASPRFGERMAVYWLDVVRYADSCGYHSDKPRPAWPYRDYVIAAFNNNKPFDQFVVEQIAGDMLEDAGSEELLGSIYNRLLQTTDEGGAQPGEYVAIYDADRVRNTGTAFLGLTTGCAQCHDHKYDPITAKDFYSFAAFFADIDEVIVGQRKTYPVLMPVDEAELARVEAKLAAAREQPDAEKKQSLIAKREAEKKQIEARAVKTLITRRSGKPREVRILPRGNWLDKTGEVVSPRIPTMFGSLDVQGRPTRLDLARWLTRPDHPLTARVMVNRLWQLFYREGLVRTPDDFGAQGQLPSHPELLDWLAVEFVESGWDVKHMVRLMLHSRTYRQSSQAASGEVYQKDPVNVYLARQAPSRLDAEFVRDNALFVSGLMNGAIGGESVKPYQPAGYWQHLNFPKRKWEEHNDQRQYRRGLYVHWQRSFLHPSLANFDAMGREDSICKRAHSNTPLQALTLLNDPTYVEAARVLAVKVAEDAGPKLADRLRLLFRRALQRPPSEREAATLTQLYNAAKERFDENPTAARKVFSVGLAPQPNLSEDSQAADLAAFTQVARAVLNLHETITRS